MFRLTTKAQSCSYFFRLQFSNSFRNTNFSTFQPRENRIFPSDLTIGREYQILRKGFSRVQRSMFQLVQTSSIAKEPLIVIAKFEEFIKHKGSGYIFLYNSKKSVYMKSHRTNLILIRYGPLL